MTTMVGTQKSFIEAIKQLVELDYDAVEAYELAINNLENIEYKQSLEQFKSDHNIHITELAAFLARCNESCPTGSDNSKGLLAEGKVKLASIFGDQNILRAMLSNEEDTNTAYERMNARITEASDPEIKGIIARGLADEIKHKAWLKMTLDMS